MVLRLEQYNINNSPLNLSFKKDDKYKNSYLYANGTINTENYTKPLEGKGHLIHDNLKDSIKYYFKDIAYDAKSVKDGFLGIPNDHEAGRINDVGMKMAGIAIATYLASITNNPRARLMEYIGLGSFLTSMSLFPKLAINTPAKLRHGFDIDKEFIDDQGRKKSVFQDTNYIPYDLYRGEVKDEDLDVIGDRLGIPKDIHNRHDVVKEQMRKIATQNNTLWMLTAGFATPTMAALMCCGIEKLLIPAIEKLKNSNYNNKIDELLQKTQNMDLDLKKIQQNPLSSKAEKFIKNNYGKTISKESFMELAQMFSSGEMNVCKDGINADMERLFESSKTRIIDNSTIELFSKNSRNALNGRNMGIKEKVLVLGEDEITKIFSEVLGVSDFKKEISVTEEQFTNIKQKVSQKIDANISEILSQNPRIPKNAFSIEKQNVMDCLHNIVKESDSILLNEEIGTKLLNFAKIMGEYKLNKEALDKCKVFKVGEIQESVIANSYSEYEKAFLDILKISDKDLKMINKSESFAKDYLDKKLEEICKNEKLYKSAVNRLAKIAAKMDIKLNGKNGNNIKNLITGIENNYNNTAKRLNILGDTFKSTIDKLVKEDVNSLSPSLSDNEDIYRFLDGTRLTKYSSSNNVDVIEYAKHNARSVGSAKGLEIGYILDRYSGSKNSFNRILHLLDTYRRAENPNEFTNIMGYRNTPEYIEKLIKTGKEALMSADTTEHILKFDTINNEEFYRDLMDAVWKTSEDGATSVVERKGTVTEDLMNAVKDTKICKDVNLIERQQQYINKFKVLLGDCGIDFTKPNHILSNDHKFYEKASQTRRAISNLLAQSPVDMMMKGAGRKYSSNRWLKTVGGVLAGVFGVTILAQFGFGKIKNSHNVKKQVNNEN